MKKMFYTIVFLSASVFIFFLTLTGAGAEPVKALGVGSSYGRPDSVNTGTPADGTAVTGVAAEPFKNSGIGPSFNRLDFVNIGTPADETAHEAAGWGPVEPTIHGGNWGGIATELGCDLPNHRGCDGLTRVTWAGDCFGPEIPDIPNPPNNCLPPAGSGSPFAFDPVSTTEPDSFALYGRAARVVLDPNALVGHGGKARQLRMRVLDGIGYDAFEVFVRNIRKVNEAGQIPAKVQGDTAVLVYRFDPYAPENLETKTRPEQWRVHTIDLIDYGNQLNLHTEPNALEVIIQATAVPWGLFLTYGQLAVDWIEILGTPKKPVKQ